MKEQEKWICTDCGTENKAEYEICYRCGALRENQKKQAAVSASASSGKKGGKAIIIALICVLVLAAAFVLYNGVYHFNAEKAFNAGDYTLAAEKAEHDLLFSKNLKKDAIIDYGKSFYDDGEYNEALDVLTQFEDEDGVKEYIDLSNKALAVEACNAGDYDKALKHLADIDEQTLDITSIKDEAYLGKGIALLRATDIEGASTAFGNIKGSSAGLDYYKITQNLSAGDYITAAKLACEYEGYGDAALSLSEWEAVLDKAIEGKSRGNTDLEFKIHAAERIFGNDYDNFEEESPAYLFYDMPEDQKFSADDTDHTVVTEDELSRCGSGDSGKILVLWEIHKYRSDEVVYYIDWDIMSKLPKDLYPESLEEVERSVRIVCDGASDGSFEVGGRYVYAVRERSCVYAGNGYNGKNAYSKTEIWGEYYPDRESYYALIGRTAVFAGLSDSLDTYIYEALRKLIV